MEAAMGAAGLLGLGAVATLVQPILAHGRGMRRRPTVGTHCGVVAVARQEPIEHVFHVSPYVQMVPHGAADHREEVGASAAMGTSRCPWTKR
jgi:hypothetical protein